MHIISLLREEFFTIDDDGFMVSVVKVLTLSSESATSDGAEVCLARNFCRRGV